MSYFKQFITQYIEKYHMSDMELNEANVCHALQSTWNEAIRTAYAECHHNPDLNNMNKLLILDVNIK